MFVHSINMMGRSFMLRLALRPTRGRHFLLAVSAFVLTCAAFTVQAAYVPYNFSLRVDSNLTRMPSGCTAALHGFGCTITPGTTFTGSFLVDDSVLTQTGSAISANVRNFSLQIGSVNWDQGRTSDFVGLRDGTSPLILGGSNLGFDVAGGTINGLVGGVWGPSDPPYLDFETNNRFAALDPQGVMLVGSVMVAPAALSEPGVLEMLALAVAGLLGVRRGRFSKNLPQATATAA